MTLITSTVLGVLIPFVNVMESITLDEINEEDVTPGVIGFAFTAVFAIAVILLGIDLFRRIRRVRYREEVRLQIEDELQRAERGEAPAPSVDLDETDLPETDAPETGR